MGVVLERGTFKSPPPDRSPLDGQHTAGIGRVAGAGPHGQAVAVEPHLV
jgi:hypothetical protein